MRSATRYWWVILVLLGVVTEPVQAQMTQDDIDFLNNADRCREQQARGNMSCSFERGGSQGQQPMPPPSWSNSSHQQQTTASTADAEKAAYLATIRCKNGRPIRDKDPSGRPPDPVPGSLPFAYDPDPNKGDKRTDDINELKKLAGPFMRSDSYRFTKDYLCTGPEERKMMDQDVTRTRDQLAAEREQMQKARDEQPKGEWVSTRFVVHGGWGSDALFINTYLIAVVGLKPSTGNFEPTCRGDGIEITNTSKQYEGHLLYEGSGVTVPPGQVAWIPLNNPGRKTCFNDLPIVVRYWKEK